MCSLKCSQLKGSTVHLSHHFCLCVTFAILCKSGGAHACGALCLQLVRKQLEHESAKGQDYREKLRDTRAGM